MIRKEKNYRRSASAPSLNLWKSQTMSRPIPHRDPVTFRQLCAVAKDRLLQQDTTTTVDWKEDIKARVVALGYSDPLTEVVYRAMDATERGNPHLCSRLLDAPPKPTVAPVPERPDPTRYLPRARHEYAPNHQGEFVNLDTIAASFLQRFLPESKP